jgi:hypothetical protein
MEHLLQYGAVAVSLLALLLDRKGASKFVPVALFASLYANLWCYLAEYFNLWKYPVRLVPVVDDINFIINVIVVPVAAIIWVKHIPDTARGKFLWALGWTAGLTGIEVLLERYTSVITYRNGYDWYFSFLLWFISWYIWAAYHKWQIRKVQRWEKE